MSQLVHIVCVCVGGYSPYECVFSLSRTNLHKAGDGVYSLVGLIEDVSPCEGGPWGPLVLRGFREETGDVLHPILRPTQFGINEAGAGVVLEQSL